MTEVDDCHVHSKMNVWTSHDGPRTKTQRQHFNNVKKKCKN